MIGVKKLYKAFDHPVLEDITIEIEDEEFLVILGRSGVGKSVFIKCIVGLLKPDRGEITIDGMEITNSGPNNTIYKNLGFVFQSSALFDSLSVFENLALPLREHFSVRVQEIKERVQWALDMVDLHDMENLYPAQLSGGMKKRVGIARAIVHKPKYIFLDEPTTGLDPQTAHKITDLLKDLWKNIKGTFIAVTHDFSFTDEVATRIAWLKEGKLAFTGSVEEFKSQDIAEIQAYFTREF